MGVTPIAGLVTEVAVAGTPVVVFAANPNGGVITNPQQAADQGLGGAAQTLYVNPVGAASAQANGTTFALLPGQSWTVISGQTTTTTVNSLATGHKFSAVSW